MRKDIRCETCKALVAPQYYPFCKPCKELIDLTNKLWRSHEKNRVRTGQSRMVNS
jgi:endogenous inhibitor of DNA gyrase (YacG/DUF329 family)